MKAELKWLEDPEVFRVNRLDAHSDHITYASLEEAESTSTSLRQSLDGTWKFSWCDAPGNRPEAFWNEGYDLSGFGTIEVPGHMEIQGFGQIQYINKLYPWDGHKEILPPQVDWDHNPVGSYVREFDLDPALVGKEVRISFQGIEKAAYIWLNGHFVGYCEDTFTPSDFDLTPYIKPTGNRLCVEVYKHCSGSWIEGQDFFRFSGIFRSVFLYARPLVEDVWFQTVLKKDNTSGSLKIRLLTDAESIVATVRHPQDGVLLDCELQLTEEGGYLWSKEFDFANVKAWDHGTPELYDVMLTVTKGDRVEYVPYKIGFRRMELGEDKVMYLNGKRLIINGVNRHEWNAETGRVITVKDMKDAMDVFLANNINAVRTSHYPNRTEWYHMCDEQGIYMMDETNLESHGSWQVGMHVRPDWNVPGSYPEWKECVLDRAKSMLERDKNHVSILFWSCGNEAFCGSNIVAMADYFRSEDPSRLVHYEGAYWPRGVANGTPNSPYWRPEYETVSDMETRMYATPAEVREYLENDPPKPYLNCEYMHNMGNSLGGMESYVSMIDEFPLYQGGFIWDYMDQALWYTNVNGERVLGYGGDFEERQSDYNFSGNGIVTADGQPKPCMQEVRYWHSTSEERAAFDAKNEAACDMADSLPMKTSEVPLTISHGDGALGVKGENFEVLFGGQGPVSLRFHGKEWFWRAPKVAFWRAPTENDCGCGFPERSAIWSSVDQYQKCLGMEVLEENDVRVKVKYTYGADVMPDLEVDVTYIISLYGYLTAYVHYYGKKDRPQLPLFGLRFATTKPVEKTQWQGLSGETYPDRYKGAEFGIHEEVPGISNYLVPQECGNHMNTQWAKFFCEGKELWIEQEYEEGEEFHFSAIPYTPGQLEQAFHREELPKPNRTVITVCGAMRGVGGIDTWGNDVEPAYHVSAEEDLEFSFVISGMDSKK